jgi:hypothetical protein
MGKKGSNELNEVHLVRQRSPLGNTSQFSHLKVN